MKNFNAIRVNAISKLVLSVSTFVLCTSILVFSIQKATANDTRKSNFNFPEKLTDKDIATVQGNGRYQMSLSSLNSGSKVVWYVLVYDTVTARSKFYYGNTKLGTVAAGPKYNLPSNPL